MNYIAIGLVGFVALVVIALLLFQRLGFKPAWAFAGTKQKAAEEQRRDRILKG